MLYGRRLDEALEHVEGSRYALVHAVAKRARQITLWLTADPAELRAEAAPPPAPGELISRDPVALSEAEILAGEVIVRWDPEGKADEVALPEAGVLDTDPLLIEGLAGDEDEDFEPEDEAEAAAPALVETLESEPPVAAEVVEDLTDDEEEELVADEPALDVEDVGELLGGEPEGEGDDLVEMPLDAVEEDAEEDEEQEE
jgi:DNA-directed RNA polymerase omega subunit